MTQTEFLILAALALVIIVLQIVALLRARHLPFAIGSSERDQWLRAMAWAMEDIGIDEALRLRLMESFFQTADWMRNKPD